ncbi:MAG: hypothetical protein QW327_01350 [Candidatus Odinarchaeota archaeon]
MSGKTLDAYAEYKQLLKKDYRKGQIWECQGGCGKRVEIVEECKGACGFLLCCGKPMKLVKDT